ncbi:MULTISPECIES: glycine cleavage system aminomethyltransferase GcvT [Brachybacterium]|uniref:Aminomethyltransferase n=2 Tax=Brachybacterium TaxID=43668 RepID=A0A426SNQ3_9MICO|nr:MULTISPECIES: glycine cleavage system aminomethyltransferase GcvT [Brachybacterium]RRR19938.1 glycine cleavage system aminomethyltransferase GcvT [Brachybacterium paraconglomeratum]GLI31778.1 aminomethyltransferase [Brachybacterium conglomeratum]GLK03311.1 aminomethyltransferase [Brachybacterium conglomeratum]
MVDQDLRSTALEAVHESLGATFTDFAGWRMPVRYDSDLAEHRSVRESAGLFDLSHMGEIHLRGPQAGEALDHAMAGKLSAVAVGRAKYTLLLTEQGGVIDDVIVYRLAEDHFLVVANASNAVVDAEEIRARAKDFDVEVDDASDRTSLIAVQGPASEQILLDLLAAEDSGVEGVTAEDITSMKYYRFAEGTWRGDDLLVARTGYTGEDGFELYVGDDSAEELWKALTAVGGDRIVPCGLACRDTLRLEAGMPLYGNELSRDLLPAQAGMGRIVALSSKGDFVGREATEAAQTEGLPVLVGLAAEGRRAARAGSAVRDGEGNEIGAVTSGVLSPSLGHPIALAYIDPSHREVGTELVVDVRGKDLPVRVVETPFYRRG